MNKETIEKIESLAELISNKLNELSLVTEDITKQHVVDHEGKWPLEKQYNKVHEEAVEANKAYTKNLATINEEHMDIFFSVITLFHLHDFSKNDIQEGVRACLIKFYERGWLKF